MNDRHFSYSSSDDSSVPPSPRVEGNNSDKGIQLTIQNLQNEQERVQKKTFTNWMNTYLCQRNPPIKVENLFEEVKDGVVLLSLLEVLSGEKLPMEKGTKLRRPHHLANISTALNFLEKRKIKLVNINATSVADGKSSIVLGLVWTIILYFQIEETFNAGQGADGDSKKKAPLAKKNLLDWAENVLSKKYGLQIKDFGKSWADGVAFNAMIHNIRPDLVDMDQIHRQQARINLEHAFSTAERELGIPRLLDPEDVDVEKPDDKSIMTYVAQFLKAYPGGAAGVPGTNIESAEKELKAYNSLMNWLKTDASEILLAAEEPITDRESKFMDYLGFKTELDRREPLYLKIGEKVLSGRALKITRPEWEKLDLTWQEIDEKGSLWLQRLDTSLPGKLGNLGAWLYEAEKLMRKKEVITDNAETMATMYSKLANEHREFFKDLEDWKQFYAQIKRAGRYEDVVLHGPQFDNMNKRLESVALHATVRQNRLDYTHMRYKLLANLLVSQKKLEYWKFKYGNQDFVESVLEDYKNYVDRQNVYETFERIYSETKKVAELYKNGGADNAEVTHIDSFLDEVGTKWKKVSMDMKSIHSMLEEVIATWKRYHSCVEFLTVWLTEGEHIMKQNLEAKEEFFKDLAQNEEKHQILNASAQFLIDVSQEPTGVQISKTIEDINRRYTDLVGSFHTFRQTEVIGKAREEYQKGVAVVRNWLNDSTTQLDNVVKCIHADLKAYLLQLDEYSNNIQEIENNFKITTRIAQSLVKDSSEEDVNVMLDVLNVQKEAIVKLRKEIPEKMKYIKAVLPNIESLETGILDLHSWLSEGEKLLNSHKLEGTPEETYAQLDEHKVFFTGTTYQKSILESKNKVYQKICGTKAKLQNVDFSPAEDLMNSSNDRFQEIVTNAKEWERKLEALARLWRLLQQQQQQLKEWLDTAQVIMEDTEDDPDSLVRKHKMFFESIDKHLLSDYESNANEILQQLDVPQQKHLLQTLNHFKEWWEKTLYQAPIRLLKLEFAIPEDKYEQSMEVIEMTLQQQQELIKGSLNLKEALAKHRQIFQDGGVVTSCEQWLNQMKDLAQQLLKLSKDENSLNEQYINHLERWKKLRINADSTHLQLKELPKRWKEYNTRLSEFDNYIQNVEKLIKGLNAKNLSNYEYKERLAEFQKEVQNMTKYHETSKWLERFLEELVNDAPDADAKMELEKLQESQNQFFKLKPEIDSTLEKSGTLSKAYDFRDNVVKKLSWLDEAQKMSTEQQSIDTLEDAIAFMDKHDAIMKKLQVEKDNIQAEIEVGRCLLKDKNTPTFVQQYVAELDRKLKDTNDMLKTRQEKIKGQVKDWENYDTEKNILLTHMKKAADELEKPLETLSQESAQKDLQNKKELQSKLSNLKDNLMQIIKLNAVLINGASQESQEYLKLEVTDIDKQLQNVSHSLNVKLTDLETSIDKWNEYNKKINNFNDWLNDKVAKLREMQENKQDTPETQLLKTEAIAKQILESCSTLESLEEEGRVLTQNFKSRETASLQSKLLGIRRQWESLCSHAKDKRTALSGNVVHWQKYQNLQEQLMPWMLKAEKYCSIDLPKCSSSNEAKELYELHQSFISEYNDNLPAFEQLIRESGYLRDQPNMSNDMTTLQKRWAAIMANSENRSQKVEKMYEAWAAYDQELENFEDAMGKIHSKLSKKPNVNSSDVRVLENELAMTKAQQEEVCSHQPKLNALTKQFEHMQEYASAEGLKLLKSKQISINRIWNDANNAVAESQKLLTSALEHRKGFYDRVHETEQWVKKMQKHLDSSSEIYSEDASISAAKLKAMKDECKSHDKMFQSLQQEFKDLIAECSEAEAVTLSSRFDKLMQDYTKMEDIIDNREELCNKWSKYSNAQKNAQMKIKDAQARLTSADIKEDEVVKIKSEMEALQKSLQPWSQDAETLDSLMSDSQLVVKDRSTQRTLHFGSELKNLQNSFEIANDAAKQKGALLGELAQLNVSFNQKKDSLGDNLAQVQEQIMKAKVNKSDLQGLKDFVRQIENIREDLYKYNPEHEQLRELGRQIIASDPTKAAEIQQKLSQMNSALETVQALLAEKQHKYNGIISTWQQYNDAKQSVAKIVTDMDHLLKQDLTFANQADVKKSLDEHKKAEFDLHTNQTHLDHMNNKGLQLLEDLKGISRFDLSGVESDVDDVNLRWETANSAIEKNKRNLEAQLACWDQVQSGIEEVSSWVNSMGSKLDDSLKHFDDVIGVESKLAKFKEEAPYFQEVMDEMNNKLKDLKELNRNKSVPSLTSAQKELQLQIEKANNAAKHLESMVSSFSEEQQNLQQAMADETQWMNQLKEDISKLDDTTGSTEDIVQRYETIKHLQQELASHKHQISAIQDKSASLQRKFSSSEANNLTKDSAIMAKKFAALIQRSDHIQNSLLGQLEQRCTTAQQHQLRWLNAAKEKVSWCAQTAGDRYNIEAKLATLKEIEVSFHEGEQKRQEAINHLDAIKGMLSKSKQGELETNYRNMEKEWQNLTKSLQQTQNKLESCLGQWQTYENRYEAYSQWLKDSESTVRTESSLKPDLASKKEQLELLKSLEHSMKSHNSELEDIKSIAQQISHASGDSRTISNAGYLVNRYQSLSTAIKDMVSKCESNIDEHSQYVARYKISVDWLLKARHRLEKCSDTAVDEGSLNMKLVLIKELLGQREEGLRYFNEAAEAGEKLYSTTSIEGRESIRNELRSLRDDWETFSDNLKDTQKQVDSSKMQWQSFDEIFEQLNKWLLDVESQVDVESELKATLPEKKALLQQCKSSLQGILSHQAMIDSINDKGTALSSFQVQNKLKQLNSRYKQLCSTAERGLNKAEDYVNEHQVYQDIFQQCQYWLNTIRDKAAVCAEGGRDKNALHNRLERLQEFVANLPEGEAKVKSAHRLGEKILPHTSPQGHAIIRRELDSLSSDWDTLVLCINDTQKSLMQSIKAVEMYDSTCETLQRWLRELETQFKECELKSTLIEKVNQVETFKYLKQELHSKQSQFSEVQDMANLLQASDMKLTSYSSQLLNKYDNLKIISQDVIVKWEGYVEEHQAFVQSLGYCTDLVNTLRKRIQVCGELVGDKQDVEDRMSKLQELLVERDIGSARIYQTIENGERLYPSTSTSGRDTLRHDIRNLRELWEVLCEEISEVQHKLGVNLSQWSSYDDNFESFQKWLLDIEVKLNECADLQTSLTDRKTQIRNHKVLHQDILSRDHIVGNLTEKANVLTQSAPSAKVKKFVGELEKKYVTICETSKSILDKLEHSLHDQQQYEDAAQDFNDLLNSLHSRLEACADCSGDKLTLKSKKDRLKEFSNNIKEGDVKLTLVKRLGASALKNTSAQGRDVIQRELNHFQQQWDDCLSLMTSAETFLDQTISMWETFESKFERCATWLRDVEQSIKGHDLKNTLKEKQMQLEKFEKQRNDILDHQTQIDKLAEDAESIMQTSADARISSQVSQLTNKYQNLLALIKSLMTRWERYVEEHQIYDNQMEDFKKWLSSADQRLCHSAQTVGHHESLENKKSLLQKLSNEKDQGFQIFSSAIESGEKLLPDTGPDGREKIREELRGAKLEWENFLSGLSDAKHNVQSHLYQWSSYNEGQGQLLLWMTETEAALGSEADLKNSLQEKRQQLQTYRGILQDITSHKRLVDSIIEKAQGVLQNTANPQVSEFISNISSRYEKLLTDAKALIQRSEQHVNVHQLYQDSLQAAIDWLSIMMDKQTLCADTVGDRHTIQNKLDRLHELITCVPEGSSKLKDCENHTQVALDTTGLKGRQNIQSELNMLHTSWEEYLSKLNSLKGVLGQAETSWSACESGYQQMSSWLNSVEKLIKECPLKSTLEEKEDQLKKYQDLVQQIKERQADVDHFTDEAQTLQHLTSESRVSNWVSQVTSRYQAVITSGKDLIKHWEQNVEDHRTYKSRFADSFKWLEEARNKFSQCSDAGNTRAELMDRLEKIKGLVLERNAGYAKLSHCVEAGEELYPKTSPEGREIIRQELRKLKLGYESIFDDLSTIQRKLDTSLTQWSTFDESYDQVKHWLKQMESHLEGTLPLKATLTEKKTQLHNYKALHQDVLSYQRMIENIIDKARSLVQTSRDPECSQFMSRTDDHYKTLCLAAKDHVAKYEAFVSEHQQYSDLYNTCVEWLYAVRVKLLTCSDVSEDRHVIQHHFNNIQDAETAKMEGDTKVKEVIELSRKVISNTSPDGKEIIFKETEALKADWEALIMTIAKNKGDLEACMNYWKDYENCYSNCVGWLRDLESRLRDVCLKATLQEKQEQLIKIKALQTEVLNHQEDLDSLNKASQDLHKVSKDANVTDQTAQFITKYKAALSSTTDLCHKWEQYVLDHQIYSQTYDECRIWLVQMKDKETSVIDTSGDKSIVQERLNKVQKFLNEKEKGMHLLQIALDNLQTVLPNTSVPGRDTMRHDMQILQQQYDLLSASLSDAKAQLDGTLSQWTMYDDSAEQLQKWLKELEDQIAVESAFQSTLQEKKFNLDRIKVLQLNILSQKSTIDNLSMRVQNLKQTSRDGSLGTQISFVVDRYDKLAKLAKNLIDQCEKNVQDHQIYRDAYMETSDWLGAAIDKLSVCSALKGDRQTIEAQLKKIEDIISTEDVGRMKLKEAQQRGNNVIPQTSTYGQELIHEELKILTNDFDHFESDLNDLNTLLKTLRDKWTKCGEQFDELSRWLTETENDLKSNSDLKASLDQKVSQFNRHTIAHGKITQRQSAFDKVSEQVQVLMQSLPDSKVSAQLTQLTSRNSTLVNLSKDLLNKYEQTVTNHEQYYNSCNRFRYWLQEAKDKLSVLADNSGDLYKIKTQLEKLQDFAIAKEEGQVCLQMVIGCGERAITCTSSEGQKVIELELQKLQTEWNQMNVLVTDIKAMLETCVVQWNEYSSSHEQVLRWLTDMERRLQNTQPKTNLNEKKIDLQCLKEIYDDIVAYTQKIISITGQAISLAERGSVARSTFDTSDIQIRYSNIKDRAKDLLALSEQNLIHHQNFHDSCHNFASWLKTTTDKLKACSNIQGDESFIKTQFERAKLILSSFIEGSQLLSHATKTGETTLPNTSATGQAKIRQELQTMNTAFDQLHVQSVQVQSDLETHLKYWQEFEHNCHELSHWLIEWETTLQSEPDLMSTLEEKKMQWEKYKVLKDDVISSQSALNKMNENAKNLLKINADAKISQTANQLATRYNGVLALAKQITKNLEVYYYNHKQYKESQHLLSDWFRQIISKLHKTSDDRSSNNALTDKSLELNEIDKSLVYGKSLLHSALDCCEKTLLNTNQKGSHFLRKEADEAKTEYENILYQVSHAKNSLQNALTLLSDIELLYQQMADWISDGEKRLESRLDLSSDLVEKRSNFERYQALHEVILAQKVQLDILDKKVSQVKDSALKLRIGELKSRYTVLVKNSKNIVDNLEEQMASYEDYHQSYLECLDWLIKTKQHLQYVANYTGDKRTLQDRLIKLQDLYEEILHNRSVFNRVQTMEDVIVHTSNVLKKSNDSAQLFASYQELCISAENAIERLRKIMNDHLLYDEALDRVARWMKMMMVKVHACGDSTGDWHSIQNKIQDIKEIIVNLDEGLQMVNFVCDQAEKMLPCLSTDGKKLIESQVTELTNDWEKLNSDVSECSAVLEGIQQRWHEYEEYYGSLIKWLADVESSLNASPEFMALLPEHKTQLDKYKIIMADIVNHHRLLNELEDRAANLKALCNNPEVADSLSEIQDRYAILVDRSKEIVELIQKGYDNHQAFSNAHQDCEKWLLAMSYRLMAHNTLSSSKMEPTNRHLDKQKLLLTEIEDYRLTLDSVIQIGQQLICNNLCQAKLATHVQAQMTNLEESYNNLQSTAHQIGMTTLVSHSPKTVLRYL